MILLLYQSTAKIVVVVWAEIGKYHLSKTSNHLLSMNTNIIHQRHIKCYNFT